MQLHGLTIFDWQIDWASPVSGRWAFDFKELHLGFGKELTDIQQDDVVHGFEFQTDFRDAEIAAIDSFLDGVRGRSSLFWMPGPSAAVKVTDGVGTMTFKVDEQGLEDDWQLHPGGYLYSTKIGEQPQVMRITGVVDNGDGTETVTVVQVRAEQESSSSSANSSSSTVASVTSSSSSGHSSSSSRNSSSSSNSSTSSQNSSSSGHSSSSSEGDSSSPSENSSSSSSSAWLAVDETWQVFPLYLVRLAEDQERVQVMAERWQRRWFRVVEVPTDYLTVVSTPADTERTEPIFLYRFTASLPDGDVVWRFTSHPEDLEVEKATAQSSSSTAQDPSSSSSSSSSSSQSKSSVSSSSSSTSTGGLSSSSSSASRSSSSSSSNSSSSSSGYPSSTTSWLSVGIEHGRITHNTRDGGTTTVAADYDSVEPLRLCVPMRLAVPLKLEILEMDTDEDEPQVIFHGTIRSPQVSGRRVTANVVEWGEAMEQKVPAFGIQRECGYRVYDTRTCRADIASKTYAVTIVSNVGRRVTIRGAGLAGLAAGWFAQGRIEYGTGLDRRVLFVVESGAAVSTDVSVQVSALPTDEFPLTGSAIAGCDGKRGTCVSKFNNVVNFGGHETPRENLVLKAMPAQSPEGGKK